MIRPASSILTPHEVSEGLSPLSPRLALALVSDARLPASLFEGLDADISVIERTRGISPLLAPGFDAILFDLGLGKAVDIETLTRVIALGPHVPVIALFERTYFSDAGAVSAIEAGAEDAIIFDPFNISHLITPVRIALARSHARSAEQARALSVSAPIPPKQIDHPDKMMTVVQETADAMVILDNEGKVAFANMGAAELLGRSLESLVGASLDFPTGPDDREVQITRPSGEERTTEVRIVETEWGGKPARVAALTDITVRRQLEQAMLDAEKKGLTSERRSQTFFSNVHHDLRTPLTHIIGFSELMKEQTFGPLSERYQHYAKDIHTSGTLLLDMIEDLLSIAETTDVTPTLHEEICDLSVIIDTAIAGQKHHASQAGVEFSVQHLDDLPGLRGDARQLRQGFYRLLAELLHSADSGARISLATELVGGGLVVKTIMETDDHSAPLLPYDEDQDISGCAAVEDPFVSAEGRCRPRDTGLSLSLTRKVIEMHGGSLHVGKDLGGRSAVILSLPAARLVR